MSYTYLFKFIIIGNQSVGKSSFLYKFINDKINKDIESTIGVEYGSKIITLQNLSQIKLNIFDTAGQECFRSITKSYYRNTIGVILLYDITNRESFIKIQDWLSECKTLCSKYITIYLVGNKTDSELYRQVSYDEGKDFAKKYNILFTETSIYKDINYIFYDLSENIYNKLINNEYDINSNIGITISNSHLSINKNNIKDNKISCCYR